MTGNMAIALASRKCSVCATGKVGSTPDPDLWTQGQGS